MAGGKVAKVERVEWTIIPDPATATAALITGEPLEPRTTIAAYDQASGQYTLYSGTGRGVA